MYGFNVLIIWFGIWTTYVAVQVQEKKLEFLGWVGTSNNKNTENI